MSGVHEAFERFMVSIPMGVSEQKDAVAAPIPTAGEFSNRHEFEQGNPKPFEKIQLFNRRVKGAFLGKRTNMEFIDDVARHLDAGPRLIAPGVRGGIDNL